MNKPFKITRGVTVRVIDPNHIRYGERYVVEQVRPKFGTAKLIGTALEPKLTQLDVEVNLNPARLAVLDRELDHDRALFEDRERTWAHKERQLRAQVARYEDEDEQAWTEAEPVVTYVPDGDRPTHFGLVATVRIEAPQWRNVRDPKAPEKRRWTREPEALDVSINLDHDYTDAKLGLPPDTKVSWSALGQCTPAKTLAYSRALATASDVARQMQLTARRQVLEAQLARQEVTL